MTATLRLDLVHPSIRLVSAASALSSLPQSLATRRSPRLRRFVHCARQLNLAMTDEQRFAQTLQGGQDITGTTQLMQQTAMTGALRWARQGR